MTKRILNGLKFARNYQVMKIISSFIITIAISNFIFSQYQYCESNESFSKWEFLGPHHDPSIGQYLGIIISLAVDPDDPENTIYAGTGQGGLFKTTNGGQSWQNLTDHFRMPGLGIRKICIDPEDPSNIYLATGTIRNQTYGIGIMKSTNGGKKWDTTSLHYEPYREIRVKFMEMNPKDPLSMIAFAEGRKKAYLYTTNDGWNSKKLQLELDLIKKAGTPSESINDIEWHPLYPNVIFVTTSKRIFRSTDNGNSWKDITSNIIREMPKLLVPFQEKMGKLELEISKSQPDKLYALCNYDQKYYATAFSTDNGNTWKLINSKHTNMQTYTAYYLCFVISEDDDNVLYVGGTHLMKSTDGGKSFHRKSGYMHRELHADKRALLYIEGKKGENGSTDMLLCGTDGGISVTYDGFHSYLNINGEGLNITEFWGMGCSEKDPSLIVGGTQDNNAYYFNQKKGSWQKFLSGDVYDAIHDPLEASKGYITNSGGVLWKYTNNSLQDGNIKNIRRTKMSGVKKYSLKFDQQGNLYLLKSGYLLKTSDDGISWDTLTKNIDFTHARWSWGAYHFNDANPDVIYASSNFSLAEESWYRKSPHYNKKPEEISPEERLWKTTNGGKTWEDITGYFKTPTYGFGNIPIYRYEKIKHIMVHPDDPDKVWAITSKWKETAPAWNPEAISRDFVVYSSDGGLSWEDYSEGLPQLPVNKIIYHKQTNNLYLANDVGVYYRAEGSNQWECYSNQLPPIMVTDIEINNGDGTIRAATMGRGIWKSPLHP